MGQTQVAVNCPGVFMPLNKSATYHQTVKLLMKRMESWFPLVKKKI